MRILSLSLAMLVAISPGFAITSTNGLSSFTNNLPYTSTLNLSFVNAISQNEESKFAIDKLSITARIITAISLRNGLSDGSIPVDNVIAELLNIGSTDLQSLEKFEKTKVDAFVDKVKTTDLSDNSEKIETALFGSYKIKKAWSTVGDLSKLPDEKTYKKLDAIAKLDVSGLKSLNLDSTIDLLGKFSTLNDQQIDDLKKSLDSIIAAIKATETMINYQEIIGILNQLKPFNAIGQTFDLYDDLTTLDAKKLKPISIDAVVSDFDYLKKLTSSVNSGSTLQAINAVISSRVVHHPIDRTYTSGFINGFNDLDKLPEDSKDEWMLKVLNPSVKINSVESLVELNEPMKKLDDKWKGISTQKIYHSMKKLDIIQNLLGKYDSAPSKTDLGNAMSAASICKKAGIQSEITKKINKIAKNAGMLNRKISTLHSIQKIIAQNKIQEAIKTLSTKPNPEELHKINEFIHVLQFQLRIVVGGKPMKDVDLELKNSEYISDFATHLEIPEFITSFNCLKNLGNDFDKVAIASQLAYLARETKKDNGIFENVKTASSALSESSASLKSIRSVANKLKDDKSDGVKSLRAFKDLQKHSKPFGEAVTALLSMKIASEKTSEFQSFVDKGLSVEEAVEEVGFKEVTEAFRKDWGGFGETIQKISALFIGIKEWQTSVKVPKESNLQDFAPIFTKLSEFQDVNLQTESRLAAIDNKEVQKVPNVKKFSDDFKKALLELSKLDLQFSRFKSSVDQMPETLKQVSALLSQSGLMGSSTMVAAVADDGESLSTGVVIILVVIGFIVLLAIGSCIFCCAKPKKAKSMWKDYKAKMTMKKGKKKSSTASATASQTPSTIGDTTQTTGQQTTTQQASRQQVAPAPGAAGAQAGGGQAVVAQLGGPQAGGAQAVVAPAVVSQPAGRQASRRQAAASNRAHGQQPGGSARAPGQRPGGAPAGPSGAPSGSGGQVAARARGSNIVGLQDLPPPGPVLPGEEGVVACDAPYDEWPNGRPPTEDYTCTENSIANRTDLDCDDNVFDKTSKEPKKHNVDKPDKKK